MLQGFDLATSVPRACPQCGATLADAGDWPAWCEVCDWGVDPNPIERHDSAFARWWRRRVNAATRKEHALVQARPDVIGRRHGLAGVAIASAVAMHLVTLALVAATVIAAMSGLPLVLRVVICAVCIGLAVVVAPRPWRHRRVVGWTRSEAPQLFALLDAVAAAVGGDTPRQVVANDTIATAVTGHRGRRTLTIGLPLWCALDAEERVAMLAHHVSPAAGSDVRHAGVVSAADESLREWRSLSQPSELEHRVTARRRRRLPRRFSSEFRLSDVMVPLGLSPFYLVVFSIGAVLRITSLRSGHRSVYAADVAATEAAGSTATRGWLDVVLMSDAIEASMALALQKDRGADLLAVASRYPAQLPERERQRLRRRNVLRADDLSGDDPPVAWRWDLIRESAPNTAISGALMAGADAELTRAEPDVRRELRTRLVDSTL